MKARIPPQNPGMAEVESLFSAKLKEASLNGFILGGHSAMKIAHDRYADSIRNGTPEESHAAALELLDYLSEKSEGLKNVGEGTANDPDSTGIEPDN